MKKPLLIPTILIGAGVLIYLIFNVARLVMTHSQPRTSQQLIIGTAAGYAPFVSINPQGNYEGFDIDVANALAKQLGKELVIKDLGSMAALFTALDQGSIDAIIWGLSITQERLQKTAMIHYQGSLTASYPLIFWQKIPAGITTIDDMKGKTVCVEPASAQDAVLSRYPSITKLPTEKVDDALLNIQYGKADAALVEPAIAKKFKNKYPEIQMLDVPLNNEDQVHGIGIMMKNDTTSLIKQISDAVEQLKAQGVITRLEQQWGIQP